MAVLIERANEALDVNPPGGEEFLTVNGSNWLFAATALFLFAFLAVIGVGFKPRAGEKIFHYILGIALFVAGISYFAYASDLGWTVVPTSVGQGTYGFTRQIFWVKYVNWVVEFPAIILILGLLSGVSWATIVYQIFLSWIWVINYLVGAYTVSNYKWGFFVFGTFAMFLLVGSIVLDNFRSAGHVGTKSHHTLLTGHTVLLWILYPIAWGLSDGGNRIGGTGSAVFYGVLDVILLLGVTAVTLVLMRKWDYGRMNIAFTQHGRGHFDNRPLEKNGAAGRQIESVDNGHHNGHSAAAPGTTV
jgi:bacteriorhodopsin